MRTDVVYGIGREVLRQDSFYWSIDCVRASPGDG